MYVHVRIMFGSRSKGCPFSSCRPASTRRTSYLLKAKKCKKAKSDLRINYRILPGTHRHELHSIRSRRRRRQPLVRLLFSVSYVSPVPYQDLPALCRAYLKHLHTSCFLYDPFKSLSMFPCARLCVFNDALEEPHSFTSNC